MTAKGIELKSLAELLEIEAKLQNTDLPQNLSFNEASIGRALMELAVRVMELESAQEKNERELKDLHRIADLARGERQRLEDDLNAAEQDILDVSTRVTEGGSLPSVKMAAETAVGRTLTAIHRLEGRVALVEQQAGTRNGTERDFGQRMAKLEQDIKATNAFHAKVGGEAEKGMEARLVLLEETLRGMVGKPGRESNSIPCYECNYKGKHDSGEDGCDVCDGVGWQPRMEEIPLVAYPVVMCSDCKEPLVMTDGVRGKAKCKSCTRVWDQPEACDAVLGLNILDEPDREPQSATNPIPVWTTGVSCGNAAHDVTYKRLKGEVDALNADLAKALVERDEAREEAEMLRNGSLDALIDWERNGGRSGEIIRRILSQSSAEWARKAGCRLCGGSGVIAKGTYQEETCNCVKAAVSAEREHWQGRVDVVKEERDAAVDEAEEAQDEIDRLQKALAELREERADMVEAGIPAGGVGLCPSEGEGPRMPSGAGIDKDRSMEPGVVRFSGNSAFDGNYFRAEVVDDLRDKLAAMTADRDNLQALKREKCGLCSGSGRRVVGDTAELCKPCKGGGWVDVKRDQQREPERVEGVGGHVWLAPVVLTNEAVVRPAYIDPNNAPNRGEGYLKVTVKDAPAEMVPRVEVDRLKAIHKERVARMLQHVDKMRAIDRWNIDRLGNYRCGTEGRFVMWSDLQSLLSGFPF